MNANMKTITSNGPSNKAVHKLNGNSGDVFVARVIIENFPSRVELYQMLDDFIYDHKYIKDYTSDNKDNIVHFIFKNTDLAYDFVKHLNTEKLRNPLYSKVKTNIQMDIKKDLTKRKLHHLHVNSTNIPKRNEDSRKNTHVTSHSSSKPKLSKSEKNLRTEHSANNIMEDYSTVLPRGKAIRISTPYIPEHKRQYQEYLRNKEKWLIQKGFDSHVAKLNVETKSIIPNYVTVSPPKIPVNKYQFRDVRKDKWVDKKSFIYKNPHDLVI